MHVTGWGCVPTQLYLQKQLPIRIGGPDWACGPLVIRPVLTVLKIFDLTQIIYVYDYLKITHMHVHIIKAKKSLNSVTQATLI